jgi:hypothetical protein
VNRKTALVMQGFLDLDFSEKQELIRMMNEWTNATPERKIVLARESKSIIRVDVGPVSSTGCPCCGR